MSLYKVETSACNCLACRTMLRNFTPLLSPSPRDKRRLGEFLATSYAISTFCITHTKTVSCLSDKLVEGSGHAYARDGLQGPAGGIHLSDAMYPKPLICSHCDNATFVQVRCVQLAVLLKQLSQDKMHSTSMHGIPAKSSI